MIEWWGPVLSESYGGTESGTVCSINSSDWLDHPGSVGRAVPPFEALVVDDERHELPANTEGRLYFRDTTGRGIVYEGDPQKTADAHLAPGVFTLGEIGYVDDDGFVYITDRFSDMVVSGGVNIYPAEAEQVLARHPDVADVACVGRPRPRDGRAPGRPGPAPARSRARRVRPRCVVPRVAGGLQVPQGLPRSSTRSRATRWARSTSVRCVPASAENLETDYSNGRSAPVGGHELEGENLSSDSTWFGDSTLGERFPAWTRGNAADVFPEPFSPLGQSLVMQAGDVHRPARRVHVDRRPRLRRVREP